jgi:hypothetical protein
VSRLSQKGALGALFLVLALALGGIAVAAAAHAVWVVAFAAGVLALWLAQLSWSLLRPR